MPTDGFAHQLMERVRDLRFRANLTQDEFARRLRVSPRTVSNWETGSGIPRPSHRRKLDQFEARLRKREAERTAAA